ncbi:MAG: hypothetical protein PHN63_04640 [Candidatus Omnitrophica bacterium]|nr:hypothetical protein [Candidatus Omnitrophota bacterium]
MNSKHSYKTSYRINGYIKSIIDKTSNEIRKKTGLKLSGGKIARTFWIALAENPSLRKRCLGCVCAKLLKNKPDNKPSYPR